MRRTFRGLWISFIALLSLFFASEAFAQFATRDVKIDGFGGIMTPVQRQNQVTNYFLNNNIPITAGVKNCGDLDKGLDFVTVPD